MVQFDKQRKKQQIEELESIVKLKRAEAEMFQFKSDEARREAEGLQRIVSAKSEKVEEEYKSRYDTKLFQYCYRCYFGDKLAYMAHRN